MYGDVVFKLGGSYYTVRYGNGAWDELKARFDVASEVECARSATSDEGLVAVAVAGLRHYHRGLTPEWVRAVMRRPVADDETSLRAACLAAIGLSLPELKPVKKYKSDSKKKPAEPNPHALRIQTLRAGMTPTEFSTVTPREAVMFIEAYGHRVAQARQLAVMTAWYTENFARTKRPNLRKAMAKVGPKDDDGDPAAAAAARAANASNWFNRLRGLDKES